jgi:PAS domain S-box-containing protein
MIAFRTGVRIARPIEEVFAFVSDPLELPRWNSAVRSVRVTSARAGRMGSTYVMQRDLPTGRADNDLELIALERPTAFGIHTTSGPTPFVYRYDSSPTAPPPSSGSTPPSNSAPAPSSKHLRRPRRLQRQRRCAQGRRTRRLDARGGGRRTRAKSSISSNRVDDMDELDVATDAATGPVRSRPHGSLHDRRRKAQRDSAPMTAHVKRPLAERMLVGLLGHARRNRMLLLAAALFAVVFAVRMSDPRPADAIFVLCVVPIVVCAIDRGPIGGVLASLVALALTVAWQLADEADVGPVGYAARAVAFLVVGVVVGRYAVEARARERRLERSFDQAVDLWCTTGLDGYFKQINPAWSRLLGYPEAELLRRPFMDWVHPADLERTQREAERLAGEAALTVSFENRYRTRDGSYRWLAWTARSVLGDGLIYASARDVTDQRERRDALELEVTERTRDVQAARVEALQRLALAAEYRDDDTQLHTRRVGDLAAMLAARLGESGEFVEQLRLAAPLHDIGKLGVSDAILLKPGRLTYDERLAMQTHTTKGAAILAGSAFPVLKLGEQIALSHHERWDGTGYPTNLRGDSIPLAGRIVAVADVFDALTHSRPYKPAWPLPEAAAEIVSGRGTQFDPRVVAAFEELHDAGTLELLVAAAPVTQQADTSRPRTMV